MQSEDGLSIAIEADQRAFQTQQAVDLDVFDSLKLLDSRN